MIGFVVTTDVTEEEHFYSFVQTNLEIVITRTVFGCFILRIVSGPHRVEQRVNVFINQIGIGRAVTTRLSIRYNLTATVIRNVSNQLVINGPSVNFVVRSRNRQRNAGGSCTKDTAN